MKKKTLICTLIATAIVVATVSIGCSYSASQNGDNETNESTVESITVESDKSEQTATDNESDTKSDDTEKETTVENTTSKEELTNKSETETEQETEAPEIKEPITEVPTEAPTIKEPVTEAPTEAETKAEYKYRSDIETYIDAVAYFSSLGYKFEKASDGKYIITEEQVRTIQREVAALNYITSEELEEGLSVDGADDTLWYLAKAALPEDPNEEERVTSSSNFIEGSYGPSSVTSGNSAGTWQPNEQQTESNQEILQWIKSNYGDKFAYNNKTYIYDSSSNNYYQFDVVKAHNMTSATTSQEINVFKNGVKHSIKAVGYMLGCPNVSETSSFGMGLGAADSIYDENLNLISYEENTENYIKKPGCEEQISYWCNWEFMTAEGIPVDVYTDGYIRVDVLYPNSSEEVDEIFTIEEYYEFCNKYADKFYIGTQYGKKGWQGSEMEDYINKWVVIKEN